MTQNLLGELLQLSFVDLLQVVAHGSARSIVDLLDNLFVFHDLAQVFQRELTEVGSVSDFCNEFHEKFVIGDHFGQLREMPPVGFFQTHDEDIQVFFHHVEEREGIDDGLVLSLFVEFYFVSGQKMAESQVGHADIHLLIDLFIQKLR